jgi:hypothetical protein
MVIGIVISAMLLFMTVSELSWSFYPSPRLTASNVTTPTPRAQAVAQDLEYLRRFVRLDRSYSERARAEADALISDMLRRASTLTLGAFELGVIQVVALSETGLSQDYLETRARSLPRLPILVFPFDDGLYVVGTHVAGQDMLGARIDRIGGETSEKALLRLRSFVGGSEAEFRHLAPHLIQAPDLLAAAGLSDAAQSAVFHLSLRDGRTVTRRIFADGPHAAEASFNPLKNAQLDPDPAVQDGWLSASDSIATLRKNRNEDGLVFSQFRHTFGTAELTNVVLDANPSDQRSYIIVDLRPATEGSDTGPNGTLTQLPHALPADTVVYVLISDAMSRSDAQSLIALQAAAHPGQVQIIGHERVALSQALRGGGCFELPNSGAVLRFTTGYETCAGDCVGPQAWVSMPPRPQTMSDSLVPDHTVPLRLEDYAAGRDALLDFVFTREGAQP